MGRVSARLYFYVMEFKLEYSELNDQNQPRPSLGPHFEREMARLCRDFSVDLRLVWGCDRERKEMLGFHGRPEGYIGKVYCQNPTAIDTQHIGWWVVPSIYSDTQVRMPDTSRLLRTAGPYALPRYLEQSATKYHYDERKDEWYIPNWKSEQVAYARWVIESKASEREKADYEGMTFDPESCQLVRDLGFWPSDGLWVAAGPFIAEHNPLCCHEATTMSALCPGKYREPNDSDLERIKEALQARNAEGLWEGVDSDNARLVAALNKKSAEAEKKRQEDIATYYRATIHEAFKPAIDLCTPKVFVGKASVEPRLHRRLVEATDFETKP